MKKNYFNCLTLFIFFAILSSILPSCNHHFENENEEENDKYDGPDKAAEFERKRNTDPSTGEVSYRKMWEAVLETEDLKNTNNYRNSSSNLMAPLTWIERGSNSDAVGPSNGNLRPGGGVTSGRMRTVWVDLADPTGKTVWVGGISGGLWKTNDVTAALPVWTLINDYLSNLAVSGICQDPTNTNTMYFCTGEAYFTGGGVGGVGVFKSTDHGITWTLLSSSSTLTRCTKILCDAAGNVYVSTMGISIAVGLQRSTNGGTSWVSINPFTTTSRIVDFEISSTGTMHVVGGLSSAPGIGGYSYTLNPAAPTPLWQSATTLYTIPTGTGTRVELACLANTLYAAMSHANKIDSIAKSTDGGLNWITTGLTATNISDLNGGGQGVYSNGIIIDPSDPNTVIVGSLRLLKSTDGGITFNKISEWVGTTGQYVHADIHNMAWYDNGNKLLVGTDGGLFYSENKGTIFSDKNTGIRIKQFYGVSIHPTSTNYFLAGAQDNGTHQFNGAGLTTSVEVLGGDGGITAIDQDEPLFQTGAYVYANFRRSSNGGASWISNGSSSSSGQFINPYDFDNLSNKVYAGYDAGQYLRWEDPHSGFTLTPVAISEFGVASVASATVSPYTANRVYFGLTNGKVFKIDNADQPTPTVTDITPAGTAPGYVNSVNIGISDQDLTVTLANAFSSSTISVWNTTNGGTSWTGIDGNLPEMPVYWALYHPDTDTKMYIATEAGVFSTDLINGTSTVWAAETTFPTVKTSMLKYRSSDRTIAASTYGRGLWTAIIPNSSCIPASITTQPSNVSLCAGANTTFSITASGTAPLSYQWQVSTTGAGGAWMNLSNTAPYSNVTTAILTITSATSSLNTYQYRVIVTGNCAPLTTTSNPAILTVNPVTTLTLTSATSTTSQTVTLSSAINNITYNTSGGVTGVTVAGLPAGVTGSYSGGTNGTFSITGIPTLAGTFSYTVTTAGGCGVQTVTGTITVVNGPSIALTSSVGSNNQIICFNTAISNIIYTAAGGVTGVTVTGLPSGVTGSYSGGSNGTFTITGTPTVKGAFNFTLTTSGGSATANSAGTINVNDYATLTLTSSVSTTSQTVNINTAITNITYSTSNGVTGAVATGLPAGLTGTYAGGTNGTVTISGSPTIAGTYNYSVTTSGGCGTQSRSGTITVVVPPSITQTSAASTSNQTLCLGNAITSIIYSTAGGVTSATVTGLPPGVSGSYSGGTNGSFTINGIPTATGIFNYTITASGGVSANGSISVNALPAAPTVNNSTFTYCQGFTPPPLTANGMGLLWYTQAMGGAGSTTAPVPSTSNVGDITYYVSQTANGCEGNRASITVTVNPTPLAPAVTSTVTYCQGAINATALSATGANLKWYTVAAGGTSSTTAPIPSTTAVGSTTYYVSQTTGVCEGPRASIVVNITAGPAITAQPSDITSCTTTATFTVAATGTGLVYQWQVSNDGGSTYANIPGANSATVVINNLTAVMANYKYRVIISAGSCGSVTSNSVTARVGTPPTVLLSASPSVSYNPSTNGGLFVTVNPTGNYTYQWKRNNIILTNVTSNSITKANGLLDEFGTYQVTVVDVATGCVGISNSITVSDITSERNRLFISPNPTQGLVKVSFYSSTTAGQIRIISLYDSKGEKLLTKTFNVAGNYAFITLDLSAFIKGNYMLVLRDASGNKIASGGIIKL